MRRRKLISSPDSVSRHENVTRESVLQPEAVGGAVAGHAGEPCGHCGPVREDSYLVDPASSRVLVSTTKPCMSKYKHLYCETANGSLYQL